jgi:DNA-binding response OmpR family regulator
MTILLVEDDGELARPLIDRFQDNGYAVLHVGDGETGLKEARCSEFGVIVLDRMLPCLSGLDVVKALRHGLALMPAVAKLHHETLRLADAKSGLCVSANFC